MSSKVYSPDKWVMIEITSKEHGVVRKILGSWYGGFAGSNSWQLSSGNLFSIEHKDHWEFPQASGSTYMCSKHAEGMSMHTMGVFNKWKSESNDDYSVIIVTDYSKEIKNV
jgi:hypothetical protein